MHVGKTIKIYRKFLTSLCEGGTSWTTVQSVLIGWSFERSEQQKKTLLHPLNRSNSHLIYSKASADSFSASYRIITTKAMNIYVRLYFNSILKPFFWKFVNLPQQLWESQVNDHFSRFCTSIDLAMFNEFGIICFHYSRTVIMTVKLIHFGPL